MAPFGGVSLLEGWSPSALARAVEGVPRASFWGLCIHLPLHALQQAEFRHRITP